MKKNIRLFVVPSIPFYPSTLYCKKMFLFLLRLFIKFVYPQSDDPSFNKLSREARVRRKNLRNKATWIEFHDTAVQSSHVIDISRCGEKLRDAIMTNFLARFRFLISLRKMWNNFCFRVEWVELPQSSLDQSFRDGFRRKGRTSNSGVMKFITVTWSEATIRRNTLLSKWFREFHEIFNLSFDYTRHIIVVYKMKKRSAIHTVWNSLWSSTLYLLA